MLPVAFVAMMGHTPENSREWRNPLHNQTTRTYTEIKRRIMEGILHPSESLTEMTLAQELGVSRNTVKKALLMLERENLVVIEESKRARVKSFSLEEMVQYLQVRELLEGFIIKEAVPLLTEKQIGTMRSILAEMKQCYEAHELVEYSQRNWRFHDVIYQACPNKPAVEMTLSIKNQFKRYNVRTILIKGRDDASFSEHCAILDAIEKRNAGEAQQLMMLHISNMSAVLQANYAIIA